VSDRPAAGRLKPPPRRAAPARSTGAMPPVRRAARAWRDRLRRRARLRRDRRSPRARIGLRDLRRELDRRRHGREARRDRRARTPRPEPGRSPGLLRLTGRTARGAHPPRRPLGARKGQRQLARRPRRHRHAVAGHRAEGRLLPLHPPRRGPRSRLQCLRHLADLSELDFPAEIFEFVSVLSEVSVRTRYPDDFAKLMETYDRPVATRYLRQTREAFQWISASLRS